MRVEPRSNQGRAALAELAERRPDIVEGSENDGPWSIVEPRIARLLPEDGEGARVAAAAFATATAGLDPVALTRLGGVILPVLERAVAHDPFLARDLTKALAGAELPKGLEVTERTRGLLERFEAIASGRGCGCHTSELPYERPRDGSHLEQTKSRTVSEKGVRRVVERELRCRMCGSRFAVTESVDYDRSTFRWKRL